MPDAPRDGKFRRHPSVLTQNVRKSTRRNSCSSDAHERGRRNIEALTERVIGCAIEVHRNLGPGLLESIYRDCMLIEMSRERLRVECERSVALEYKGQPISRRLKLDLLVEGCLVVELKAVEQIHPLHLAQVITYLKLTGCPAGLLMNFNSTTLRAGLRRLDHPDRYVKKTS